MNLTRNFYRFSALAALFFVVSYSFHRLNPVKHPDHGYPLSVLLSWQDSPLEPLMPGTKGGKIATHLHEDRIVLPASGISTLTLDALQFDVELAPSSSDHISISLSGEGAGSGNTLFTRESSEGELRLRATPGIASSLSGKFRIDVPATVKNIKIRSVSGDLDLKTGASGELDLSTVSGGLKLHAKNAHRLIWNTTSGDAEIGGTIARIKAHSVSGDLSISLPPGRPVALSFKSVSGEQKTEGRVKLGSEGIPVEVETVSGDLILKEGK